jgi:hypothetical protein
MPVARTAVQAHPGHLAGKLVGVGADSTPYKISSSSNSFREVGITGGRSKQLFYTRERTLSETMVSR